MCRPEARSGFGGRGHLLEESIKKSDIFMNVYSIISVDHAEKSRRFIICSATFWENDNPGTGVTVLLCNGIIILNILSKHIKKYIKAMVMTLRRLYVDLETFLNCCTPHGYIWIYRSLGEVLLHLPMI